VKNTESPGCAVYEYLVSAWAVRETLNVTDHKLWGKHEAGRAAHSYVVLDSSHLDCSGRDEGKKPKNGGGGHVVETGRGERKS